eukprot:TRINITY_DN28972_c0_g2_i1.p1 TRINITY_DN28972_c0_g2~~TRINITY_DN28972_c0_g2_i1.p1  ORF type:complete len:689 (+),score=141.42 TRINITY_DN28972_c0_g2_i1:113-2179(+)
MSLKAPSPSASRRPSGMNDAGADVAFADVLSSQLAKLQEVVAAAHHRALDRQSIEKSSTGGSLTLKRALSEREATVPARTANSPKPPLDQETTIVADSILPGEPMNLSEGTLDLEDTFEIADKERLQEPPPVASRTGSYNSVELLPHVELLPLWHARPKHSQRCSRQNVWSQDRALILSQSFGSESDNDLGLKRRNGIDRLVVDPNSSWRTVWDLLGLINFLYDVIMVPLQFFDLPESLTIIIFTWITRVYWTIDVVFCFFTGILRGDGTVERSFFKVAKTYLRTWFALDISIALTSWLEVIFGDTDANELVRMGKASRTLRVLRMFRLLRMVRLVRIFDAFVERVQSQKVYIMSSMSKLVLFTVAWSHMAGCLWYAVGIMNENGWTRVLVEDSSLTYRYFTSLHWALSQLTGGMDEVRAVNSVERIFAVMLFGICFIMATVFNSHLTSSMTQLHLITSGQAQQLSRLRRYLIQSGISNRLLVSIQRNAKKQLKTLFISAESVDLLKLISAQLKMEMHVEMYQHILCEHPFFSKYSYDYPHVMRQICDIALSTIRANVEDVIFSLGDLPHPPRMYFVHHGTLDYIHASAAHTKIKAGTQLAEAALWAHWMHRGDLFACEECELLAFNALEFQKILPRYEHTLFNPWAYAAAFVEALRADDLSDAPSINVRELIEQTRHRGSVGKPRRG